MPGFSSINAPGLDFQPAHPDLPIFTARAGGLVLFYTPGYALVADAQHALSLFAGFQAGGEFPAHSIEDGLISTARAVVLQQARRRDQPYEPVCLTLYPSERCNLACVYCFAEDDHRRGGHLSLVAALAGARLVAENCRRRGLPLMVGMHGGGEPGLEPRFVDQVLDEIEGWGLPLYRYIATNGVLPPARACWIARRFDHIGLSCDGPPEIQDGQRPRRSGSPSSAWVERTARSVRDAGKTLSVRVTVTAQSLSHMAEIAEYVCGFLHPGEVHFEAAYLGGRSQSNCCLSEDSAEIFLDGFWQANQIAAAHGIRWSHSAARMWEGHGPYCNYFRDVLQLVPGDVASACFKRAHADSTAESGVRIGWFDPVSNEWRMDRQAIAHLQAHTGEIPAGCRACFLAYSCTHNCANHCLLDARDAQMGAFCRVERGLVQRRLVGWVDEVAAEVARTGIVGLALTPTSP